MLIYKLTNIINNKVYIGQTNDFKKRLNGHKSNSTNKKSHSYTLPLYSAIRKYGWENFSKEILEESPDNITDQNDLLEWANEREAYYIEIYNSLVDNKKGYNISRGGGQSPIGKLTQQQKAKLSKLFTYKELRDIQEMLLSGTPKKEILKKYEPRLKESYLDNINSGANFKDSSLNYPLYDYTHAGLSKKFSKEQQDEIIHLIENGIEYKDISEKYGLSIGIISMINNGKTWKRKDKNYPLSYKKFSRLHNLREWVLPVKNDLQNSDLSIKEIAKKYNKSISTIKKINYGNSYREENQIYPLTKNRNK